MSHFYASIQGGKGMATRQGTKNSGIEGHIMGWRIGARVLCTYDPETDLDICKVFATGGSSGGFYNSPSWANGGQPAELQTEHYEYEMTITEKRR